MDWKMIQWCQFDENEIDSLEHMMIKLTEEDMPKFLFVFRLTTQHPFAPYKHSVSQHIYDSTKHFSETNILRTIKKEKHCVVKYKFLYLIKIFRIDDIIRVISN